MSGWHTGRDAAQRSAAEEDAVRRLVVEAGPRPPLPDAELRAIERAVRGRWQERYTARPRRRRGPAWWIAAAAGIAAALGLLWWAQSDRPSPPALPQVAAVQAVSGPVFLRPAGSTERLRMSADELGRSLVAGSELETDDNTDAAGRIALRLAGGGALRLDAGSRLKLLASGGVQLDRGAVYFDALAGDRRSRGIDVRTPLGVFTDVGTRFEVRLESGDGGVSVHLRVRDGRVAFAGAAGRAIAAAGEGLTLRADGTLLRHRISPYGPDWEWVVAIAPRLDIEGIKVRRFLDWVGRENGWQVEIADRRTAELVDGVILHGSIDHLTVAEAPRLVLHSCGLAYRVTDGKMVVFTAGAEGS